MVKECLIQITESTLKKQFSGSSSQNEKKIKNKKKIEAQTKQMRTNKSLTWPFDKKRLIKTYVI